MTAIRSRVHAVAGIPLCFEAPPGVDPVPDELRRFGSSRITDEVLLLRHTVGVEVEAEEASLRPVSPAAPLGVPFQYFADELGRLAVGLRGHVDPPERERVRVRQLLRAVRPGFEYDLRYVQAGEAGWTQWRWHRVIFSDAMPWRGRGLVAHATDFVTPEGRGILCPGVSGAGKSTLARQVAGDCEGAPVLSDDRVVVRGDEVLSVWGTPWFSTAMLASPADAPLRAVVFPQRGGEPRLSAVPPREAVRRLLRTFAFPFWNAELLDRALGLVERIVDTVPLLDFSYAPGAGAGRWLVAELERLT